MRFYIAIPILLSFASCGSVSTGTPSPQCEDTYTRLDVEEGDSCMEYLPKAEFVNNILELEIKHYLDQQLPVKDTIFWNLEIAPLNSSLNGETEYKCVLLRSPQFVPDAGCAYVEYYNEIIVITGELNKSFFKIIPSEDRKMLVLYNRIASNCQVPYISIILSEKRIDSMQSVCDNTIDRHK